MDSVTAAKMLQFLFLLGIAVVLGAYYWMYAAHSFAVVVEETAAGIDEVKWPDLPIVDCIGRMFFLVWLAALAAIPVWVIAALAVPALIDGPLGSVPVLIAGLWLIFPIMLLSSLSGRSKLVVLHAGLLRRLVRRPFSLLLFYILSGLVLFGAGLFGVWALTHPVWLLLAAPVGAAAVLIHGRFVGRLAWLLGYQTPIRTAKKKAAKLPRPLAVHDPWAGSDQPEAAGVMSALPAAPSSDVSAETPPYDVPAPPIEVIEDVEDEFAPRKNPYAIASGPPRGAASSAISAETARVDPEEEEDEWTPRKRPYGVLDAGEAPAPPPRTARVEPSPDPYAINAHLPPPPDPSEAPSPDLPPPPPEMPKPSEEVQLWLYVRERPKPPKFTFFSGILTFPVYRTVLRPWIQLCVLSLAWSFSVALLVSVWP